MMMMMMMDNRFERNEIGMKLEMIQAVRIQKDAATITDSGAVIRNQTSALHPECERSRPTDAATCTEYRCFQDRSWREVATSPLFRPSGNRVELI